MENKELIQMIEETKSNLEIIRQISLRAAEELDKRGITINDLLEKKKFIEVAKIAQRYGVCPEWGEQALAQHLSKQVNPLEAEVDDEPNPEIAMQPEPEIAILKKALSIAEGKYNGILHAVIGNSTLCEDVNRNSLSLNYREIMKWIWANEPELANARIEELELEEERFRKFNAEGHTNDEWAAFIQDADEKAVAALSE